MFYFISINIYLLIMPFFYIKDTKDPEAECKNEIYFMKTQSVEVRFQNSGSLPGFYIRYFFMLFRAFEVWYPH